MVKLNLEINNKIEVIYEKKNYKSIIQDINEENKEFFISIPVLDGEYLILHSGTIIEHIYYDDKGNVFKYKSKVIEKIKEDNIPLYKLSSPYDIKKIQRRDFVRVNFVRVINYVNPKEYDEADQRKALLLDLSGGGMKIKVADKLSNGDLILSKLVYEDITVSVKGTIVRVEKTSDKKFVYGVNFIDLDNSAREKIIQIVFTIMRKQRELK
jgi:c-di-GMP-binding flagellar brake protein YcgR